MSGQKRSGTRRKATSSSPTTTPCHCGFLVRVAAEPNEPVVFHGATNEYHIVRPQGGYWIVFYCPQCGGVASKSTRHELFALVTQAEVDRLEELTANIKTVDEAIQKLGQPEDDMPQGMRTRAKATTRAPARTTSYRVLRFKRLSDTVDVELTDFGPDGVRFTYQGKYLGERERDRRTGTSQDGGVV